MFGKLKREKVSIYDEPINAVLLEMQTYGPGSPEYTNAIAHLETLSKLKAEQAKTRVSADTMAVVVGNLLGILTIVAYEQKHVVTSKAIGMVRTPK